MGFKNKVMKAVRNAVLTTGMYTAPVAGAILGYNYPILQVPTNAREFLDKTREDPSYCYGKSECGHYSKPGEFFLTQKNLDLISESFKDGVISKEELEKEHFRFFDSVRFGEQFPDEGYFDRFRQSIISLRKGLENNNSGDLVREGEYGVSVLSREGFKLADSVYDYKSFLREMETSGKLEKPAEEQAVSTNKMSRICSVILYGILGGLFSILSGISLSGLKRRDAWKKMVVDYTAATAYSEMFPRNR